MKWILLLTALTFSAMFPARARAQAAETLAEQLFQQGRALMAKEQYADACPKFEESQRLDPSGGTLLNLADCYEKTNRFASAWVKFQEAAAAAHAVGRADVESQCAERARRAEERASSVTLIVPPNARVAGLDLKMDGTSVPQVSWGTPIHVDGGKHAFEAVAPGMQGWTGTLTVAAEHGKAQIEIPELTASPVATPAAETSVVKPRRSSAGLVVAAVGLAGVAFGAVSAIVASSNLSDAKSACPGYPHCTPDQAASASSSNDAASTWSGLATAGLIGGGVLLAVGATMYVLAAPKKTPPALAARDVVVTPLVDRSNVGVSVEARW